MNIVCFLAQDNAKLVVDFLIDKSQLSCVPTEMVEMIIKVKFSNEDSGASHIYAPKNVDDDLIANHTSFRELEEFEFQMLRETMDFMFNRLLNDKFAHKGISTQLSSLEKVLERIDNTEEILNRPLANQISYNVENLKMSNGAIDFADNVKVDSLAITKFKDIVSSNKTEAAIMNSPLDGEHQVLTILDSVPSFHDNQQHTIVKESNTRINSDVNNLQLPIRPYNFSPLSTSTVNVVSLEDTVFANTSNCDDNISPSKCNLRSAIEYCKVRSCVSCIIQLPLYSHVIQRYGAIKLSSTAGTYCDIVIQGGNSVISASSSHNDRFMTVTGPHALQFYDMEFERFGNSTLLGGVMYFSEISFTTVTNVTFDSNTALSGGAIYL